MEVPIGAAVAVITAISALFTYSQYKASRHQNGSRQKLTRFKDARCVIKEDYAGLVEKGLDFYAHARFDDFKLLGKKGWIFDRPRKLGTTQIKLSVKRNPDEYKKTVQKLSRLWPAASDGGRIAKYSDAISGYDRPTLWSEGTDTYRLVEVTATDEGLELSYEVGKYHDATDTQEAFGFVSATDAKLGRYLPSDPFDLRARCASTAICTLTLLDSNPPRFVFHHRSPTAVHQGVGQFHIVPAGEFEPAVVDPNVYDDFDFWTNIRREYAEEFLGLPDGLKEPLADRPEQDHPMLQILNELHDSKDLALWEYGLGLNPVTLKPEILVIGVLNTIAENAVLPELTADHEGAKRVREFRYDELSTLMESPKTNPAAHALFKLAWRDRHELLSNPPQE